MVPDFEDALNELLGQYRGRMSLEEQISALELKLYALKEEEQELEDPDLDPPDEE